MRSITNNLAINCLYFIAQKFHTNALIRFQTIVIISATSTRTIDHRYTATRTFLYEPIYQSKILIYIDYIYSVCIRTNYISMWRYIEQIYGLQPGTGCEVPQKRDLAPELTSPAFPRGDHTDVCHTHLISAAPDLSRKSIFHSRNRIPPTECLVCLHRLCRLNRTGRTGSGEEVFSRTCLTPQVRRIDEE